MLRLPPFDKIGVTPVPDCQNADPTNGVPGSILNMLMFNQLQHEGENLELLAGLTPSGTDLTQWTQAISRGGMWLGALTGTGDLAVATLPVVLPALLQGMRVGAVALASNATTTPKLRLVNYGSQGLQQDFPIVKADGSALAVGDIKPGRIYRYEADGAGNVLISGGGLTAGVNQAIFNALQQALVPVPFALSASGVWTKPANLVFADIRCIGSGAGGALGYNNSGTFLVFGGGGGNGGFARRTMAASALPASVAFTLGAPGVGYKIATAGFGPGTDGGDAAFGSLLIARGGKGAPQPTVNLPGAGGAGGGFVATDEVYAGAAGYGGERNGITAPTPFGSNGMGGMGGARTTGGPAYDGQDGQPGGLFILQYILAV